MKRASERNRTNYPSFEEAIAINKRVLKSERVGVPSSGNLRFCLGEAMNSGLFVRPASKLLAVKAGRLLYCIVRNHPFLDGNKRTAYEVAQVFLFSNGYDFEVDAAEAVSITVGAAAGKLDELAVIEWVGKHLRRRN